MTPKNGTAPGTLCWSCRAESGGAFFCDHCGKILPVGPGADYFTCLGLPRKLAIDTVDLEKRYHALSRRFHPDFFQRKSDREQAASLENSAFLNQAYRALRDPFERAKTVLRLEEGARFDSPAKPSQDLLMEVLEIQEALGDYKQETQDGRSNPELRKRLLAESDALSGRLEGIEKDLHALFSDWDGWVDGDRLDQNQKTALLSKMKALIDHRAYLTTVAEDLKAGLDEKPESKG